MENTKRKENIKNYIKYMLKKSYREDVYRRLNECSIEVIQDKQEKSGKKVYLLRRLNEKVGTFSDVIVFLRAIDISVQYGYIPIIDRKTVKNIFMPASEEINTWELFFEQPLNLRLDDVDYNRDEISVFYCGGGIYPVSILRCKDNLIIDYWRALYKRYIRFNSDIIEFAEKKYVSLFKGKRTLGISVREGYEKLRDMHSGIVWGHPVQKGIEELLNDAEYYLDKWNCEYVFFTCQTIDTKIAFERKFRNKAKCLERKRVSYEKLAEGENIKKELNYEKALENEKEYITEMILLSKCTSMICSENSGSEAAFIMSNGYENMLCYDNGRYR